MTSLKRKTLDNSIETGLLKDRGTSYRGVMPPNGLLILLQKKEWESLRLLLVGYFKESNSPLNQNLLPKDLLKLIFQFSIQKEVKFFFNSFYYNSTIISI